MNYCGQCGGAVTAGNRFCGSCGAQVPSTAAAPTMPLTSQQHPAPPHPAALSTQAYYPQVAQKSSGVAVLLTILLPGAGHMYLGLTRKGTPYVIINAVFLALWLLLFVFLPIAFIVWLVTLLMTVTHISDETAMVNQALIDGVPVSSLDKQA